MKNKKRSNCTINSKTIIAKWKSGETVVKLSQEFHCSPSYIRKLMIATLGKKKYREGCKQRIGKLSVKYKRNIRYPGWMMEGMMKHEPTQR